MLLGRGINIDFLLRLGLLSYTLKNTDRGLNIHFGCRTLLFIFLTPSDVINIIIRGMMIQKADTPSIQPVDVRCTSFCTVQKPLADFAVAR